MNIGILSLAFALVGAIIVLVAPKEDKAPQKAPDYTGIYENLAPREI